MPHEMNQRLPQQTRINALTHPAQSRQAYSQDLRTLVMRIRDAGWSNDQMVAQLRNQFHYPSLRTERRWVQLQERFGHYRPCRKLGNSRATVLRDHDLMLLSLYRVVFPKATAPEINAFLYRANFGNLNFRFYSSSQISEAEKRIGLTRKRGSTTAYQALLPINIQKRWNFWNLPYPFGIADISRHDMIDIDECGVFLESSDRSIGKAYIGNRATQAGPYSKSEKWTLLLAISGDPASNRWRDMWLVGGTTGDKMIGFIENILQDIGPGTPERRYCFTMDNLRSHHNRQMAAMIHEAGHRLIFRAPYYPTDGPIEFVFNTIQGMLINNMHKISSGQDLIHEVGVAIAAIPTFEPYFTNSGFWRN